MTDPRPPEYLYWKHLLAHIGSADKIFSGEFIWPRQMEIHLPADHKRACNVSCPHCAGKLFDKSLARWEPTALRLLDKIAGSIPYHIYSGAYTEPALNPYYLTFLAKTKEYKNHFGMHVNGTCLKWLEENQGWLTELNRLSTDRTDYLSISIDAGTPESWAKTKGTKRADWFYDIMEASRLAVGARVDGRESHAIRWCYLISKYSGTEADFESIIRLARDIGVDSLRFSIPFANYNQDFARVRKYKYDTEQPMDLVYRRMLEPYLSKSFDERPYVFFTGPEFTDIDRFDFKRCVYGAYQITLGADGYVYRCGTTATPTAPQCRLGPITDNLEEFKAMIRKNQSPDWDGQKNCFAKGLRGNRMALEINSMAAKCEK